MAFEQIVYNSMTQAMIAAGNRFFLKSSPGRFRAFYGWSMTRPGPLLLVAKTEIPIER